MSLQTLIRNIQDMEMEQCEESEWMRRDTVELLEREKKFIEQVPDLQLNEEIKKLRQAHFKANYKKRKVMGMMTMENPEYDQGRQQLPSSSSAPITFYGVDDELNPGLLLECSFSSSKLLQNFN
ncbi:protein RKD1-like [Rutidosis leptorrhynchoides]|uniref:protein RKD1-like n=1 Tax=Rutidosis leptorrhynchoides TaxID=125765 RepID=UPI003A99B9D2